MNILKVKKILFLGIGGVSMYQLALAYLDLGAEVYGYDANLSGYTKICMEKGAKISNKFEKSFLNVDLCIKSSAISEFDPYIINLRSSNVPVIERSILLNEFCKKFKTVIAVAGTHGKSTTASLIYHILRCAGKKVSCHIGADVYKPRFNLTDEYLVVEACEYKKNFLNLYPNITVVTNVEQEHMDSYCNMFNLQNAFLMFCRRGKIRFASMEKSTKFLKKLGNVHFIDADIYGFNPKIKGKHNQKNIALAVAVARELNIGEDIIKNAVNSFVGVPRRYELIGVYFGKKIYIDYAHHPTEIQAFLSTYKQENNNYLTVFQPHTYSRTKLLLNDFINVLSKEQNLCIYKEYPARENRSEGVSAYYLYKQIKKINPRIHYATSYKNVIKLLNNRQSAVFIGAGDINVVAKKIVEKSKKTVDK